ncbi:MAG: hypothetical protein ABW352_13740 [Polyangiales bacterium]
MAASERIVLLAVLMLGCVAGCVPKDRPLDPAGEGELDESPANVQPDASRLDAQVRDEASRDATTTSDASATQPEVPEADVEQEDAATVDASMPERVPDAAAAEEDARVAPDARVDVPVPPPVANWCKPNEEGCREFDFERDDDGDPEFGFFWCYPYDCSTSARPELEAPGSTNHVWISRVSGTDAKALGNGMNWREYQRAPYKHAEIDFDFWPVSVLNEEKAVWFSLQRIVPVNSGRAVLSLVSNTDGTYVYLGPTFEPTQTLRFSAPPAIGARTHVRIVLDRIDDTRSSAAITYGSETITLSSFAMPLYNGADPAPYDHLIGLFDSQQGGAIGAPTATARYDNFVARTTFPD